MSLANVFVFDIFTRVNFSKPAFHLMPWDNSMFIGTMAFCGEIKLAFHHCMLRQARQSKAYGRWVNGLEEAFELLILPVSTGVSKLHVSNTCRKSPMSESENLVYKNGGGGVESYYERVFPVYLSSLLYSCFPMTSGRSRSPKTELWLGALVQYSYSISKQWMKAIKG